MLTTHTYPHTQPHLPQPCPLMAWPAADQTCRQIIPEHSSPRLPPVGRPVQLHIPPWPDANLSAARHCGPRSYSFGPQCATTHTHTHTHTQRHTHTHIIYPPEQSCLFSKMHFVHHRKEI